MLNVVEFPNSVLTTKATEVVVFDDVVLKNLIDQMVTTMYASGAVGLAAPQVNVSKRIVVIDHSVGEETNSLLVMINPVLLWTSDEHVAGEEGCLSLPGVVLNVNRSAVIDVEYHDVMGVVQRMSCHDKLKSRIIQHEVDHLNGIMMIDKVGSLTRKLAMKGYR